VRSASVWQCPLTNQITAGCAPGSTEHFDSRCRSVWATLPGSLAAAGSDAAVVAIDGTRTDWLDSLESMITRGAAGVVVAAPSLCDRPSVIAARLEWLRSRSEQECIPIVIDSHWSASLSPLTPDQLLLPNSVLIESVAVFEPGGRPAADVLLDQFMSTDAFLVGKLELLATVSDSNHYCIAARTPTAAVQLLGVRSHAAAEKLSIRCYAPDADLIVEVPGRGTACPVQVHHVGAKGDQLRPTRYESPPRSSWRRLHHAVTSGTMTDDLSQLIQAMRLSSAMPASG
jgi:hypothetical protein